MPSGRVRARPGAPSRSARLSELEFAGHARDSRRIAAVVPFPLPGLACLASSTSAVAQWPTWLAGLAFVAAALAVLAAGTRLSRNADELADRTGIGEALTGAIFLGATTSLPGITASVTAAIDGYAQLALSNAVGGIAAQTAFLAIADVFHREANLEHAAASAENLVLGSILIVLLGLLLFAFSGPQWVIGHVHPISVLLLVAYPYLLTKVQGLRQDSMWRPRRTRETIEDEPSPASSRSMARLWLELAGTGAVVVFAGWMLTRTGETLAERTGISQTVIGAGGIAIATSLPELVTSIAAVRHGALTLAVGGILGGNAFDTLFAAVADIAYTDGSIYAGASTRETALAALTTIMVGILLIGLVRREKSGPLGIGFESLTVLLIYLAGGAAIVMQSSG